MTIETKAREWAHKNWADTNDKGALNILERAYLAGAAEQARWIPVSERLPEIGVYVWILIGDNLTPFKGKRLHDGWSCFFADGQRDYSAEIMQVMYWQPIAPLPPHPEKEPL